MSPREITEKLRREIPLLRCGEPLADAVRKVRDSGIPALPVVDEDERYVGMFGEREFIAAVFPGYMKQLKHAAFVPKSLDAALGKRATCPIEPVEQHMNTDHVELESGYSDVAVAETFLHHRVSVLPILEDGRVIGVLTRGDFFRAVAERVL